MPPANVINIAEYLPQTQLEPVLGMVVNGEAFVDQSDVVAHRLSLVPEFVDPEPQVIDIAATPEDMWSKSKAERIIRRAAQIALRTQVEVCSVEEGEVNILTNLKRAEQGDETAFQSLLQNMLKEKSEISYKAGMVTKAVLRTDQESNVWQHGQTSESINTNSLVFGSTEAPEILLRTKAETRNGTRISDAVRRGQLKDNYFMVVSRCADLKDERLDELGFFVDTKSLTVQLTSQNTDGTLELETVFIAGVTTKDGTRHDVEAVEVFGRRFGVDFTGLTDSELIDRPQLVPKEMLPEGVVDCAAIMDDCIAEVTGKTVFFGQDKPRQDYVQYREACYQKEADLLPEAIKATKQLINEVNNFKTPVEASQRLHKLAEAEMVFRAVHDTQIDPMVFGQIAAAHIEQARLMVEQGDMTAAVHSIDMATKTAKSSSCPSALRGAKDSGQPEDSSEDGDCPEVKDGQKVNCPYCKQKVSVIVRQDRLFCSNGKCEQAHSSVKGKNAKEPASKPTSQGSTIALAA